MEKIQCTQCVCVCAFARLLCRDRWLIEYRAMWVSVCVNESKQGGAVNLGAVRTDGRWEGPQAARDVLAAGGG